MVYSMPFKIKYPPNRSTTKNVVLAAWQAGGHTRFNKTPQAQIQTQPQPGGHAGGRLPGVLFWAG